jgi:F-type H+-transporting ATPase subunit epsilon
VAGEDLSSLKAAVETQFRLLDDRERQTRTALAQLESNLMRLFMKL